MNKMYKIFTIVIALVFCASATYAVPDEANVWGANGAVTGNWNTAANWEIYTLDPFFGEMTPTGTYAVPTALNVAQVWSGLVQVDATVTATVAGLQTSNGSVEITDGELNISGAGGPEGYENLDIGRGLDISSTLTVSGGTLNLTGSRLNIAKASDVTQGTTAVLNQTGGAINAEIVSIGEIAYDDATVNGYSDPWPTMAGSGTYNMTSGTLDIMALNVGKGIEGTMNISGDSQVTCTDIRVANQQGVKGTMHISENASVTGTGGIIVGLGEDADATFTIANGTFSPIYFVVGDGANSTSNVTLSGNARVHSTGTGDSYMGRGENSISNLIIEDTAEIIYTDEIRMGWGVDSVSRLTIKGGAFEATQILAREGSTGASIIEVVGSDPNRILITNARLQLRNNYNSELRFVLDNGGVTPIRVLKDHAVLNNNSGYGAPTITVDIAEDFEAEVDDSFVLIQTETAGKLIYISGTTIVNQAGIYDFDVEVVNRDEGGQALVATVTNVDTSCERQIALGNVLTGDFNEDCIVNIEDLAVVINSWLTCYNPEGCN